MHAARYPCSCVRPSWLTGSRGQEGPLAEDASTPSVVFVDEVNGVNEHPPAFHGCYAMHAMRERTHTHTHRERKGGSRKEGERERERRSLRD